MIEGTKARYSKSLYELKGCAICLKNGEFVDLLDGIFPEYIAQKILAFHLKKKLGIKTRDEEGEISNEFRDKQRQKRQSETL